MSTKTRTAVYEGWDLPNGSDSGRFPSSASGATANVQSGGWRVVLAGVTGGYAERGHSYLQTPNNTDPVRLGITDWDITLDFTVSNAAPETYVAVSMGDAHSYAGAANNGYTVSVGPQGAAFAIQRRDGGTQTDLVGASFTVVANTTHRLLWSRRGGFLGVKVWTPVTSIMPPTWTATAVDNTYRGPLYGLPMLGFLGGNVASATTCTFDNLTVDEHASGRVRRSAFR